jgi:ATP-dependent DNA helicase DinG
MAIKQQDFGGIIPRYDAVIFDEAHEIEDIAGQYFGTTVSNLQVQDLTRDILDLSRRLNFHSNTLEDMLRGANTAAERFFNLFGDQDGRTAFVNHDQFLATFREPYTELLTALEMLATQLQLAEGAIDETIPLHRRCVALSDSLRFFLDSRDPKYVYWVERRGRLVQLQATPIDVSSILTERLFEEVPSVILTSATLAVSGGFDFLKQRLGLAAARSLVVDSPFDWERQALLYVPQTLGDPRNPGFPQLATKEIIRLLQASRGRAFCLFTSYQQMRAVHDRVAHAIDYPILLQGTRPRHVLLEEFKATPHAVLFATSSFWQGVDVQGDQLSLVVIDKLPFAVPSDPVVQARSRQIDASGGNSFRQYSIPQAAIALKQGFGRLIRARSDKGVLVLLDVRITAQPYGQIFFDSLPGYSFTTDFADVEQFLASC